MTARVEEPLPTERDELVEYLRNVVAFARRQQSITAKLSTDAPHGTRRTG